MTTTTTLSMMVGAPTAAPPSMRFSTSIAKLAPSASPIACASSIIARHNDRVPGSVQITSSVAWVSALIGLKHRLPHSFIQISSRSFGRIGALKPASRNIADSSSMRSVRSPDGSPSENRSPLMWRITPGSGTSLAG